MRRVIVTFQLLCVLGLCGMIVWQVSANPESTSKPIYLLQRTIDPETLPFSADSSYAILQLHDVASEVDSHSLQQLGVTFLAYIPEDAFLVQLPTNHQIVLNHKNVRWIGAIDPSDKLSPALDGDQSTIFLFPHAEIEAAITAIRANNVSIVSEHVGTNSIRVNATLEQLKVIAAIDSVQWIQPTATVQEWNDDVRWATQNAILDTFPLHEAGLTGVGQVGAVADSGLAVYDFSGMADPNVPSCFFADDGNGGAGGTILPPSATHRKVLSYTIPADADSDMVDGSGHGSHVVGSLLGDAGTWGVRNSADGLAYNAQVFFQDVGKNVEPAPIGQINPPTDYRDLFAQAYDPNGDGLYQPASEPRTHSNSWGSPAPIYNIETAQTDEFMWTHPDFLIFYAAGNQGPTANTVGYPALAKNIVTVGGTENGYADFNNMGSFSSHGSTPTQRLKPTIGAPGDRITSALRGEPCATAERSGTSMATPIVHGATLLMRQYLWDGFYPTGQANAPDQIHPSAALLKALAINGGRPISGDYSDNTTGGSWPSNGQGWGRLVVDDVLYLQGDHRALWLYDEYAVDGSIGFDGVGQTRTFTLTVGDGAPFSDFDELSRVAEPLKISLVWTDYPSTPIVGGLLVNDLHLTVTDPLGGIHRGNEIATNDFRGTPDLPALSPDTVNPWEVVYLENPITGTYTITVEAATLGSLLPDPTRKQGFALVATGDLLDQTRAEIEFDTYDVGDPITARLRVVDSTVMTDTITVTMTSSNDSTIVTLARIAPNSPIFADAIMLGTDLTVAPTDTIDLIYQGFSDSATITSHPLNFINPPTLSSIDDEMASGTYTLTWTTPETTTLLSHYVVQETTEFVQPLFDDAEGDLVTNWTTDWTIDTAFQVSGANSFYSGRGDALPSINKSLSLNHNITLPVTITSAYLGFYSRYFNDFNDYGWVEISADNGNNWTELRHLYADPRLVPSDSRMQYHQFDLGDYIGDSIRVRFRYDNGVFSQPPDSPGWWVDDVVIAGGAWRTIAESSIPELLISGQSAGHYHYRVRGIFADGSGTGWSNVEDVAVVVPTALELGALSAVSQGGSPHTANYLPLVAILIVALAYVFTRLRFMKP